MCIFLIMLFCCVVHSATVSGDEASDNACMIEKARPYQMLGEIGRGKLAEMLEYKNDSNMINLAAVAGGRLMGVWPGMELFLDKESDLWQEKVQLEICARGVSSSGMGPYLSVTIGEEKIDYELDRYYNDPKFSSVLWQLMTTFYQVEPKWKATAASLLVALYLSKGNRTYAKAHKSTQVFSFTKGELFDALVMM